MIELVDFESVKDEVDEVLIHVVHLNDEVCLVNGLVFVVFTDLMQDSLAL